MPTTLLLPKVLTRCACRWSRPAGSSTGGLAAALAYGAAGIAMGTRFLMSAESPVPRETLERYVAVGDPARIRVSDALDGLPQRMIDNPYLLKLERFGPLRRTWFALKTAEAWRRQNGLSTGDMLGLALALRSHDYTASQTLMAANAPFLIQRAIVEGRPDEGVPSGQAAAMIGAIESCDALIARIVADAGERLDALAARRAGRTGCVKHNREALEMTASNQPAGAMPFRIDRADGIAELVIAHPPVNALDAQGWHARARSMRWARTTTCA